MLRGLGAFAATAVGGTTVAARPVPHRAV